MGIPKFFRYISERYPCVTEKLKDYQIPEFDNLYLDVNGIIHACSHPNDTDVMFRISEETIMKKIFRYLELLFQMIQPQKLFFVAIDGVAPRAKINQQRGRRFRSAKEAELMETRALRKGIKLPAGNKFDSNCITPGTLFMSKLDKQLKYFITYKITTDKFWQRCKVIFSGSQVPGEGEHKIMDYIRYMKSQPDYDINTTHCLYGLDADLIMLGLCTHEIHCTLLREEVIFGRKQKKGLLTPEETKFCLFHISLLREYIDHEFSPLREKLQFPYDLEKIIDDWVLMGFLVGNDFIPHLPNLHIAHCALSVLTQVYLDVLPTLDGYINESGTLRLERFEKFMERLGRFDILRFLESYDDLKFLESKTGKPAIEISEENKKKMETQWKTMSPKRVPDKEFDALLRSTAEMSLGKCDDEDWDDETDSETYTMEFVQRKADYYMNKLKYDNIDEAILREQAEGYVRAIQWNLHYYYNGCCSWSWYYPHHYAPYISDIKDFKDLKLEFEMGRPFLPFEQLLAVLPPHSKQLLPAAFQDLLTDQNSPIIDYYPWNFETDLNCKEQEWEAVVLIPFIDEKDLLAAMAPHYSKLTADERERNKHGAMCVYSYTEEEQGVYMAPEYFPDIISHAKVQMINHEDILVPREKLIRGVCPGVSRELHHLGFPTLQYIDHTISFEKSQVKVFQGVSNSESMILHVKPPSITDISTIASNLIGKTVYINWPHLKEALVIGVSHSNMKLTLNNKEHIKEAEWSHKVKHITWTYKTTMGIDIGDTQLLVHVQPLIGKKYVIGNQGKVHLEKQWSDNQVCHAYQTVLKDIPTYSKSVELYKTINDIFVPGTTCFMLGHPYYGSIGTVQESGVCKKSGRIKVSVVTGREPLFETIKKMQADIDIQYKHRSVVAQRLGISSLVLGRIFGTVYVKTSEAESEQEQKMQNIGLSLQSTKKFEEIPGYTRQVTPGYWLYSPKAIELVRSYMAKFPELFERLAQNPTVSIFQEEQLFRKGSEELRRTVSWLKEQLKGLESRACSSALDNAVVKSIESEVDAYLKTSEKMAKVIEIQVQPQLLYTPSLGQRNLPPDPNTQTELWDRVCCVKQNFTVPLGYKGTVIGIQKVKTVTDIMYDILFDKTFAGGLSINGSSEFRAYRLSPIDFINITHGERVGHNRGSMDANTESAKLYNSMSNQEAQSRANASAFASYKNRNHFPRDPSASVSPRPRVIHKNPEGMCHNYQLISKPKYNPQSLPNVREPFSTARGVQMNAQRKPLVAEKTSEFQTIWNELHRKQVLVGDAQKPPMVVKKQQVNERFPEIPPQDPSALLKAMLKIPVADKQQAAPPPAPRGTAERLNYPQKENKALDTLPLVQQLFDHARLNKTAKEDRTPIWYCSQLLNYYQVSGAGMPRYSYTVNTATKLIQAQILLPDKRIFVGDPCVNHELAAGSAAKKVYKELKLINIVPNMKALLPPPLHWYASPPNSNLSHNVRPPVVTSQAPQPELLQLFPEWVQKGQDNPGGPQTPKQNEINNVPRSETKNCRAFVPLQAQKKSRPTAAVKAAKKLSENQSSEEKSHVVGQQKKEEPPRKTTKVEVVTATNNKAEIDQSSTNQGRSAPPVIQPKKSRVAAKFNIPGRIEEKKPSENST